jgi:hypothetical protein
VRFHVAEVSMFRQIMELSTFYRWWWTIDYQFEDGNYICYASISDKQLWLLICWLLLVSLGYEDFSFYLARLLCGTNSAFLSRSVYHALTECPMAKILYMTGIKYTLPHLGDIMDLVISAIMIRWEQFTYSRFNIFCTSVVYVHIYYSVKKQWWNTL